MAFGGLRYVANLRLFNNWWRICVFFRHVIAVVSYTSVTVERSFFPHWAENSYLASDNSVIWFISSLLLATWKLFFFLILYSWECSFANEGWFPWPGSGSWGCPNSWMLNSGFWSYWTLILGEGFRRCPQWLLHPLWGGELPSMQWCLLRSSPATVKFCPIPCTVTREVNWTGWLVFWPPKWSSPSLLIMVLKLFSWFNNLDKRLSWELSLWANCRFGFHKNMSLPDWFFILFCFPCLRELLKWVMS